LISNENLFYNTQVIPDYLYKEIVNFSLNIKNLELKDLNIKEEVEISIGIQQEKQFTTGL